MKEFTSLMEGGLMFNAITKHDIISAVITVKRFDQSKRSSPENIVSDLR